MPRRAGPSGTERSTVRWVIRETLGTMMVGALLLGSAGRWDWLAAWATVAIYAAWVITTAILVVPRHPDLLMERVDRRAQGVKGWDRAILGVLGLLTVAKYVLAGLEIRFGWSGGMPDSVQLAGGVTALAGYALVSVSMAVNPFFSTVARIQTDRGHAVATTGPYRWVRHPGYLGASVFELATPLLLGSWYALPLGVAGAGFLVLRTGLEDRMLRKELAGYAGFARAVRWRLVPGLW